MYTVIILNQHSSDLLKNFRFLFKPFTDAGYISFCDWNESGTDIKMSVPDLYKLIRGKQKWRAMIIETESVQNGAGYSISNELNPFDYLTELPNDDIPRESSVPLVRLTHMLCGYPSLAVKKFEKGYEYTDEITGEVCRVFESEMSQMDLFDLSERYGKDLKPVYIPEEISDEKKAAQKVLVDKYSFADNRPQELFLVATRNHPDGDDQIYEAWKTNLEIESSNFCEKNNYPSICRFLCYSITNMENSMYMKELLEFWLSVLSLSINNIPASVLQAYRLYSLGIEISKEELKELLNVQLNRLKAAREFVSERLRIKPQYSFEPQENIVERQKVPVIYENVSASELYVNIKQIGLCRDCPQDELSVWNEEMRDKQKELSNYLKMPRRAIEKSCQYLKVRVDGFYGDEYELDEFQRSDLVEEIDRLGMDVMACDAYNTINERKINEKISGIDKKVKKAIAMRMRRSCTLGIGGVMLGAYALGYIPYLIDSVKIGTQNFVGALVLLLLSLLGVSIGGIAALFILREKLKECMGKFNEVMKSVAADVNASARKFEVYFSAVCTYMKAQSVYLGIRMKKESKTSEKYMLKMHREALDMAIGWSEELAAAYEIKREAEALENVGAFFNPAFPPKNNPVYYFQSEKSGKQIPVNASGNMVNPPYSFVSKLKIEREMLYENMKGDGKR